MAAQFTLMKGASVRRLMRCIPRAISSLPVPVSPKIRTVASLGGDHTPLIENLFEGRTVPDDLGERAIGFNLAFQILLFVGQTFLEGFELGRRSMIFRGQSELQGDVVEQAKVVRLERAVTGAIQNKHSQRAVRTQQRYATQGA